MTDQKESNILWLMVLVVGAVSICLSVSGRWPLNLFDAVFGISLSAIAGWKLWQRAAAGLPIATNARMAPAGWFRDRA